MYKYVSVKKCILFILQDSLPSVLYLQMDNTCMKGTKDESVEQFCQPGNTLFLFYCPVLHIFTMTAVNWHYRKLDSSVREFRVISPESTLSRHTRLCSRKGSRMFKSLELGQSVLDGLVKREKAANPACGPRDLQNLTTGTAHPGKWVQVGTSCSRRRYKFRSTSIEGQLLVWWIPP